MIFTFFISGTALYVKVDVSMLSVALFILQDTRRTTVGFAAVADVLVVVVGS
jgi:hypothetical protein